ncbi:MAG: hypothetical protein MUF83_07725 [Acidimicrobiales bacterium]|nr:hypothetical protein [Acidimicrobiales bacterium]
MPAAVPGPLRVLSWLAFVAVLVAMVATGVRIAVEEEDPRDEPDGVAALEPGVFTGELPEGGSAEIVFSLEAGEAVRIEVRPDAGLDVVAVLQVEPDAFERDFYRQLVGTDVELDALSRALVTADDAPAGGTEHLGWVAPSAGPYRLELRAGAPTSGTWTARVESRRSPKNFSRAPVVDGELVLTREQWQAEVESLRGWLAEAGGPVEALAGVPAEG